MKVVGLDLSLTSTGLAGAGGITALKPRTRGVDRLIELRHGILTRCVGADVAVIEGYSLGTARQSSHAHGLGELGGVIRVALTEADIPFTEIAPSGVKRYATGKGNASKDQVLTAISARTGIAFATSDECDAWCLWQMGLAHYTPDHPDLVQMPQTHRVALDAVEWPAITEKEPA